MEVCTFMEEKPRCLSLSLTRKCRLIVPNVDLALHIASASGYFYGPVFLPNLFCSGDGWWHCSFCSFWLSTSCMKIHKYIWDKMMACQTTTRPHSQQNHLSLSLPEEKKTISCSHNWFWKSLSWWSNPHTDAFCTFACKYVEPLYYKNNKDLSSLGYILTWLLL